MEIRTYKTSADDDYTIVLLGNKMRALKCILKDYFPMYIEKLKEWINCKISRTEFEEHVRPFFDENSVLIHNEFLICFLNEIRSYKQETNDNVETSTSFASLSIAEQETKVSGATAESCLPANSIDIDMRKMSVPDDETWHALTLVNAWEGNCTDVNKRVVPLLHNTKGVLAKLLRDAILYRKKAIFVRPDGSEYDATDVKDEDVTADDVPKYSGNSITVGEIKDAIINEKNLHQFKHLLPLFLNRDI
ncbi:hypothetical protein JTE90_020867 [Oedothorax gibbosus]|uniref:Transcriptional adapter 1 n=1 Tax=Oedothorax gibbosus TaxID=931172 RepID=A0AAV6UQ60_9ARAC|nr:hypothetical protein JTE90_020867 [Oedothorax gibbosus]